MMNNNTQLVRSATRRCDPASERGVALVTTLLLLMLLSAITIGMVLAASSDELINGYYRNIRGSFYAADSGLNIVRQAMRDQLQAAVPTTMPDLSVQPLPSNTPNDVVDYIESTYGSNTSLNGGYAANSWPAGFRVTNASLALQNPGGCVVGGTYWSGTCDTPTRVACAPLPSAEEDECNNSRPSYTYTYDYNVTVAGETRASEQTTLADSGSMKVEVTLMGEGEETSFAAWGFFLDHFTVCGSLTLVPGTVTGPAFSNDGWTFGTSGTYTFTDPVGQHNANMGYRFGSTCKQSPNDPYTYSGQTINPNFQSGVSLNQDEIALPENAFSQKRAVLDGIGACLTDPCSDPGTSEMDDYLRNGLPAAGVYTGSNGVYLPYTIQPSGTVGTVTCPCKLMTGGGIYVRGNSGVTLATSGTNGETYTIVQGSTTTVVTVNPTTNTTTIKVGTNATQTILGVPQQKDSDGNLVRNATMLYVDGNISSLSGVVNDQQAINIVGGGNVVITNDITYKTKPVTTAQNQIPGTPPATLIPGNDNGQVLGIYTNGGNIQLNNQGNSTLDIQASLAALHNGGTNTIENIGSAISTLNIMGGRIQNDAGNINTTTRNIYFDRRFSSGGFAPPWFPSTTVTNGSESDVSGSLSVSRVQWLNQTPF